MPVDSFFIKKNTPELRKRIRHLGIKFDKPYKNPNAIAIVSTQYYDKKSQKAFGSKVAIQIRIDEGYGEQLMGKICYNCGTNETLFLALAALRDDTDEAQFFTDGEKWVVFNPVEETEDDNIIRKEDFHKATPKELIEKFKDY